MNNKYIFSLREELAILITHNNPLYNYYDDESAMNLKLGTNLLNFINTAYSTTSSSREGVNQFLEDYKVLKWDTNHYVLGDYIKEILDLFSSKFADECILKTNGIIPSVLQVESNKIFDKILNLLCETYDKYKNLLDYYTRTKGELLKAIEDTYVDYENYTENTENSQASNKEGTSYVNNSRQTNNSREASSEGKSTMNDTPQNVNNGYGSEDFASNIEYANSQDNESTEGIENSQFVNADTEKNNITNTGNNFHNRNLYHVASHDRDTLIERLNQIDTYYTNVYRKWITEFEPLVWEVANYEKY